MLAQSLLLQIGKRFQTETIRHQTATLKKEKAKMLWTILVVLVVLWLLGFGLNVGGGLIHLLLVVALIVLVINLITGRRPV